MLIGYVSTEGIVGVTVVGERKGVTFEILHFFAKLGWRWSVAAFLRALCFYLVSWWVHLDLAVS